MSLIGVLGLRLWASASPRAAGPVRNKTELTSSLSANSAGEPSYLRAQFSNRQRWKALFPMSRVELVNVSFSYNAVIKGARLGGCDGELVVPGLVVGFVVALVRLWQKWTTSVIF